MRSVLLVIGGSLLASAPVEPSEGPTHGLPHGPTGARDGGDGEVHYVDATLEFDTDLLSWRLVDVDGDGSDELCLAMRSADGGREIRVHDMRRHGVATEPRQVVPVLPDVIAFCFADVRAEPGRELLFLTRSGVWSYSLLVDGYRGNVARLVEEDLLYDVPDPHSLDYWPYVLPGPNGAAADRVLLPGRRGYSVWAPPARDAEVASGLNGNGEPVAQPGPVAYERSAEYEADFEKRSQRHVHDGSDEPTVVIEGTGVIGSKILVDDEDHSSANLLTQGTSFRAPAMLDVDGDGTLDLLRRRGDSLHVHLAGEAGLGSHPTRVEPFPEYMRHQGEQLSIDLVDLDGDGDVDILARRATEQEGLESRTITLLVLENDGRRLLPETPTQVLRFEAAELISHVADVDGDGKPDLVLRKFEMPSLLQAVTGLEFRLTHLLYLGREGRAPGFERKPALRHVETFDEETVLSAVANRKLRLDCDGDGVADLVEIDVHGRATIRRLRRSSSVFRGESWSLDDTPWKRIDVRGNLDSLTVLDLNGDGLGDIVSSSERSLMVLMSDDGGGSR